MSLIQSLRSVPVLLCLVVASTCTSAAPAPTEGGPKLSILPPIAAASVEPRVAPPGTPRRIVISGTWPTGCVPTGAVLHEPVNVHKPAIGVIVSEPMTLVACTAALTPYQLSVSYTPTASGQTEVIVMSSLGKVLAEATIVTGDAANPRALLDAAGAYFDPATAGSGVMIAHDYRRSDQLFATWQIYEQGTGAPRWFSIQQGTWSVDGTAWTGSLYETRGGPAVCALCPMPLEQVIYRGQVRFTFSVNGANGGLDAALDLLPAGGAPQRLSNLRRFLPERLVIFE